MAVTTLWREDGNRIKVIDHAEPIADHPIKVIDHAEPIADHAIKVIGHANRFGRGVR